MRFRLPWLDLVLAALAVLAAVAIPPHHLAAEHHGEAAADHEGEDHVAADHEVVAPVVKPVAPLDVRPADLVGFVDEVEAALGPALARHQSSRDEIRPDPGGRERPAAKPASPRAPPALRA